MRGRCGKIDCTLQDLFYQSQEEILGIFLFWNGACPMILNRGNIESTISGYLISVNSIRPPLIQDNIFKYIHSVKRAPLGSGPYKGVSLFEASNRIFSDMLILFGVYELIEKREVGNVRLPFTEYEVSLGVEGDNDIRAKTTDCRLVGEAFNVAKSFFQAKKSSSVKKLKKADADYKLIMFNQDAVTSPDSYIERSAKELLFLPVDTWKYLDVYLNK